MPQCIPAQHNKINIFAENSSRVVSEWKFKADLVAKVIAIKKRWDNITLLFSCSFFGLS
jgi:hypothetical protein